MLSSSYFLLDGLARSLTHHIKRRNELQEYSAFPARARFPSQEQELGREIMERLRAFNGPDEWRPEACQVLRSEGEEDASTLDSPGTFSISFFRSIPLRDSMTVGS